MKLKLHYFPSQFVWMCQFVRVHKSAWERLTELCAISACEHLLCMIKNYFNQIWVICNLRENPIYILCRLSHNWLNNHAIRIKYKIFGYPLRVAMAALYRALEAKWAYIGKYFMSLPSIYVLYSNVSCIYPLSCLVEIKIATKKNIASKLVIEQITRNYHLSKCFNKIK